MSSEISSAALAFRGMSNKFNRAVLASTFTSECVSERRATRFEPSMLMTVI